MSGFFAILTANAGAIIASEEERISQMSVREIENAITQLPTDELTELVIWLEEYYAAVWEQQIEQDLEAGRLDDLLAELDEEYAAGLAQPL